MAGSFATFALVYFCLIRWCVGRWDELGFAIGLSARNFLPFLGSLIRFSVSPKDHVSGFMADYANLSKQGLNVDWMVGVGLMQSLIGTVLLFLFLLALRNKFRLK